MGKPSDDSRVESVKAALLAVTDSLNRAEKRLREKAVKREALRVVAVKKKKKKT